MILFKISSFSWVHCLVGSVYSIGHLVFVAGVKNANCKAGMKEGRKEIVFPINARIRKIEKVVFVLFIKENWIRNQIYRYIFTVH